MANTKLGDFDLTDLIFGSGGRARDGHVVFVSSGTTVDRLQALAHDGGVWISNSLACLLAVTNTALDPHSLGYYEHLGSIVHGLSKYERRLDVSAGSVQFTYFHNLKWDGTALVEVKKPDKARDFTTFTSYRDFLSTSLGRVTANVSANGREHPYRLLGTSRRAMTRRPLRRWPDRMDYARRFRLQNRGREWQMMEDISPTGLVYN